MVGPQRQKEPCPKWTIRSVFTHWKLRGSDWSIIVKLTVVSWGTPWLSVSRETSFFAGCLDAFKFELPKNEPDLGGKVWMLRVNWKKLEESFPCLGYTPNQVEISRPDQNESVYYRRLGHIRERSRHFEMALKHIFLKKLKKTDWLMKRDSIMYATYLF